GVQTCALPILYITVLTQMIAVLPIKLDAFLLDIIVWRFDFQYNRFVAQIMIIIQQSRTDSIAPTCCIHYKMFDKTIFRSFPLCDKTNKITSIFQAENTIFIHIHKLILISFCTPFTWPERFFQYCEYFIKVFLI